MSLITVEEVENVNGEGGGESDVGNERGDVESHDLLGLDTDEVQQGSGRSGDGGGNNVGREDGARDVDGIVENGNEDRVEILGERGDRDEEGIVDEPTLVHCIDENDDPVATTDLDTTTSNITTPAPSPPPPPTTHASENAILSSDTIDTQEQDAPASSSEDLTSQTPLPPPPDYDEEEGLCVLCYENQSDTVILPCNHTNFCSDCLSRLTKRKCPTCRGRCRKLLVNNKETTMRGLIHLRHRRDLEQLRSTYQILFLGSQQARIKRVAEKVCGGMDSIDWSRTGLYNSNAMIGKNKVKVSILTRERGVRRMMMEDLQLRRPDVIVLCFEVGKRNGFEEMLEWDRLLRGRENTMEVARIWMMITKGERLVAGEEDEAVAGEDVEEDVVAMNEVRDLENVLGGIRPWTTRPKGCCVVGTGNEFSIGLRCLRRDVVYYSKKRRDSLGDDIALPEVKSSRGGDGPSITREEYEMLSRTLRSARDTAFQIRTSRSRRAANESGNRTSAPTVSAGASSSASSSALDRMESRRSRAARRNQDRESMPSLTNFINWLAD